MKNKVITVFGATGFIGNEIVRALAAQGHTLRLACRYSQKADTLKIQGSIGQIVPMSCDYSLQSLKEITRGCDAVVNCTGILFENKKRTFMGTHCTLPAEIATACRHNNVPHFVHISALGIDKSTSKYAQSKLAGEKKIKNIMGQACTILRPSIVFGTHDNFFNMFAQMANILPTLPLVGGGKTLFQPVYVGDVAQSVMKAINDNHFGTYELGGQDVLSFRELLERMRSHTKQNVRLLSLPFWIAGILATVFSILPKPPLTHDQIKSLKTDNIVNKNALTLAHLGVKPTSMDSILPKYLKRYIK